MNTLGDVIDFINQNLFDKEKADQDPDSPFSYQSEVRTGTDENHAFIFLTSKKLLSMATNDEAIFHIDCTYKIVVNRFPVLIFGRSDCAGQFFPMVVCVMSHETIEDFTRFYQTLKSIIFELFQLDFKPMFIMQDAQDSCWVAGKAVFPSAKLLTCYFHVLKNIKTRIIELRKKKLFSDEQEIAVIKSIQKLHYTTSQAIFEIELFHMLEFWKSIGVVQEFSVYFLSEWCGERWNTWKIFDTPMGFASTNNPVESQNKQFKQFFTCWVIKTLHRAILMICKKYLVATSKCVKKFSFIRHSNAIVKLKAKDLNAERFVRSAENEVLYFNDVFLGSKELS